MRKLALVAVAALAGCNLTAGGLVGPSEATQIAVMEQCRAGFGVGGEAEYQVDYGPALGGGRAANVLIVPFGQVTPHWADRINDCAAAQLEIVPLASPVVATTETGTAPRTSCFGQSVSLYRGSLYCRVNG